MEETEATAAAAAAAVMVDTPTYIPQCCCGRPQEGCPFLAHNTAKLAGLERDVQTAARLGQVSESIRISDYSHQPAVLVLCSLYVALKPLSDSVNINV